MPEKDFLAWAERYAREHSLWFMKRLSAHDTQAAGSRAGFLMPRKVMFKTFPALHRPDVENPDVLFDLHIDSHPYSKKVRAVWHNSGLRGGRRNEVRVTRLGGKASALLDQDNTGALSIFAFMLEQDEDAGRCCAWVFRSAAEEDLAEYFLAPLEPGRHAVWSPCHEDPFRHQIPDRFLGSGIAAER